MAYTIYNCTALTGGAERALDALSVDDLATNDRAICVVSGVLYVFSYSSTGTDAEQVTLHPYIVRPDDYAAGGNWTELIGGMTNTSKPAFLVAPTANQENIAPAEYVTVIFGTEVFDQASNFAANTFTAPVTGKYQLSAVINLLNLDKDATAYQVEISTSNRDYTQYLDPTQYAGDFSYWSCTISVLADMDAADTAIVRVFETGGGLGQTDVFYIGTYFSGYLVC